LRDGLAVEDVLESIVNANAIKKVLRSRALARVSARERLYVIESPNFSGAGALRVTPSSRLGSWPAELTRPRASDHS